MVPVLTAEQRDLGAALRKLMVDFSDDARVREIAESEDGFDQRLWEHLVELGVVGLAVPEELGGQGGATADLVVAFEEAGRALACVPLLSGSFAMAVLTAAGGPAEALRRLCGGSRATVALAEDRGGWEASGFTTTAVCDGDRWTVTGVKRYVLDGPAAEEFLVAASCDGEPVLLLVAAVDATVEPVEALDLTRPLASVRFDGAPAALVAAGTTAQQALRAGLDTALVLVGAEQAGASARCLEMAVEYAKVREQFGVAIGSFQAIKHKCADMLVLVEGAQALVHSAAAAFDRGDPDAVQLASAAKAYCSDAAVRCAQENIQIHGGIGFTWEHPAHLYLRRAKSTEVLFGTPAAHRERVVALYEQRA